MSNSGIYQIKCYATGKSYVGSTKDFGKRWKQHTSSLKKGKHHSPHLQAAWNKHGQAAFGFMPLEAAKAKDLNHCENKWIKAYQASDRRCGYNIKSVATRGCKT